MRLEEIGNDTRCSSLDYLVLCDEKKVQRLERLEGRWAVVSLSWCSTSRFLVPATARLLREREIPFVQRFDLHEVPDKKLSEHFFSLYRVTDDLTEMVAV